MIGASRVRSPWIFRMEGCLLLSLVVCGVSRPSCKETHSHSVGSYVVVIDAGSTGSRVLTVRVHKDKHGQLQLSKEPIDMTETEPGLSSFADNPRQGRKSIEGLLRRAESFVPEDQRSATPLVLRATAGLRNLPADKQEALMAEIRGLLLESQFNTTIDPAAVISGSDEGVYDWLAVNFLLNRLDGSPRQMAAALDMGGGSTQVVFPLLDPAHSLSSDQVRVVQLAHQQVTLYSQSYLGLGVSAARVAVLSKDNQSNLTSLTSACVRLSTRGHNLEYNGVKYLINGTPSSLTTDYSGDSHTTAGVRVGECRGLVQDYVSSFPVDKPRTILQFDIVAFSGFYYTAKEAGLLGSDSSGGLALATSMEDIANAVERICRGDDPKLNPFLCLDLIFIHTLLTEGYGFQSDTTIKVVRTINNYVVTWSLGLAYQLFMNDACLT